MTSKELETQIWNTVHNWCDAQSNEIPDQNRRYLMDEMKALVLSQGSKSLPIKKYEIDFDGSRAFEYRVIDHDLFDEDEVQAINSMGSNGWDIIKILEPMKWLNSDGMFVRIYYKREKQS